MLRLIAQLSKTVTLGLERKLEISLPKNGEPEDLAS